jgi:hypothetical protein
MEAFYDLRRFVYGLRKRYIRSKRPPVQPVPLTPGLPAGIELAEIETICQEALNEKLLSVSYLHLSGWKSSGAYRLFIQTGSSRQITLIYKNALYEHAQIPALTGLPTQPGPPEFTILSQPVGSLATYLPQVYLAEEVTPGMQYRYVLEDLFHEYKIVPDVEVIINSSRLLAELQQALVEWSTQVNTCGLIEYGRDFSIAIQEYAHNNLRRYEQHSSEPILKQVLANWSLISELHLAPAFFTTQNRLPLHGDSNYTNIHLHRLDPRKYKVVDWEWAGFGSPYADLASLMKGVPPEFERKAFRMFSAPHGKRNANLNPDLSEQENWRLYQWCQLERGLLDASFLAAQHVDTSHSPTFSLPQAVTFALRRVWAATQQLSK